MVLPKKHLPTDRSLIYIGGEVLGLLDRPSTITGLWKAYQEQREKYDGLSVITYDWFVLAIDLLYMLGVVHIKDGFIRRETHA